MSVSRNRASVVSRFARSCCWFHVLEKHVETVDQTNTGEDPLKVVCKHELEDACKVIGIAV